MAYTIDKNLEAGMKLLAEGKKIDNAFRLINKSARKGTTKGKSYFEIGRIIREGVPGLAPNVEDSRQYFDQAVNHFFRETCDSMDYRELGDYFFYGLGSEPINLERALEYYELAAKDGDKAAQEKVDLIKKSKTTGKVINVQPNFTLPTVEFKEAQVAPGATIVQKEVVKTHGDQNAATTVGGVTSKPIMAKSVAPVMTPMKPEDSVPAEAMEDELLVKAIRMIDSPSSTAQERLDGIELAKTACEEGSMRAAILLGYLSEGDNGLVEKNLLEAKKYYELAQSRGSASAEFRLGKLYLLTEAPYYDSYKGHQLILDSARKGYPYALNYLGDCFREKVSDPRNLEVAYRYYSLAGERGLGLAYHNMAEIDASRQQIDLAKSHENYAIKNGYDVITCRQDPLHLSLHF